MAGFTTYIANKGKAPSTYREFRGYWNEFLESTSLLEESKWVAGGTATSAFAGQWSPYAVPSVAFVVEGSALWYTNDSGANWAAISLASSVATGRLELCFDTTAPTGYLYADGAAVAVASYSALNTYLNARISATNRRRFMVQNTYTSVSLASYDLIVPMAGIAVNDTVDVFWNSGANSRLGMTVTVAASSAITVSGGAGDALPNSASPILFSFNFSTTKFILPDFRNRAVWGTYDMGSVNVTTYTDVATVGSTTIYYSDNISEHRSNYGFNNMYCAIIIKT